MLRQPAALSIDELDLKDVAQILRTVYPQYSLCECARMAAVFAPDEGCVCTLCGPGTYPDCVRQAARTDGASQDRFKPAA